MKKQTMLGVTVVMVLGLGGTSVTVTQGSEKKSEATQTKVGVVRNVDVPGKKIVVMVARELTFTVTEKTKIHRGDDAKKLADIKVDTNVRVEYTRTGDNRVATNIAILGDEKKSEPTQTKVGEVESVDVAAKKIVVMVTRELTFTVTEKTRIHRRDDARRLADIKVGAKVKVAYTRTGDTRIATDIAILGDDEKK